MPKIDADAPIGGTFLRSSLIYGPSRAGKTTFQASYPRPAIFASEREGGYKSVQTMDRALWYEEKHKPLIYAIGSVKETLAYFKEVETAARQGKVRTIVIELTFYSQDVIKTAAAVTDDKWSVYRLLDDHIQWLDRASKKLGIRIAYNALAVDGDAAAKVPGGLLLAGKALAKSLPASTDLTGYLHTEDKGNSVDRVLRLAPYGNYPAGHRFGGSLPLLVRNATFKKLEDLTLGWAAADDDGNVLYGEAAAAARAARAAGGNKAPAQAAPAAQIEQADPFEAELPPL